MSKKDIALTIAIVMLGILLIINIVDLFHKEPIHTDTIESIAILRLGQTASEIVYEGDNVSYDDIDTIYLNGTDGSTLTYTFDLFGSL